MRPDASAARPRRRGFTLVELLVVIGIIALLISILLPALSKARQQGLKVADLANIRSVAAACIMYAGESKGTWPRGERGTGFAGDDVTWVWRDTFDMILRFGGGGNYAADVTSGGKIAPDRMKVASCNSWLYDSAFTDQLGQVGGTGNELKMGWNYYGGRSQSRLDGTLRNYPDGSAAASNIPKYVWPKKMGDKPTTTTLLTCYGYTSSIYSATLPHAKSSYNGLTLPNASQPYAYASKIDGMNMAYVDGSASWVPTDNWGCVTSYSGGWVYYDRLAN